MPIRIAGPADIDPALTMIGRAFGLAVRAPTVHTLVANAHEGNLLVAERDGAIVGTGASCRLRPTGWLGGVAVAGGARRGLGRALTARRSTRSARARPSCCWPARGPPDLRAAGLRGRGDVPRVHGRRTTPCRAGVFRPLTLPTATPCWRSTRASRARTARWRSTPRWRRRRRRPGGGRAAPALGRARSSRRTRATGAVLLRAVLEPGLRLAVPEANEAAVGALLAPAATERPGVCGCAAARPCRGGPTELWGVFCLFFG